LLFDIFIAKQRKFGIFQRRLAVKVRVWQFDIILTFLEAFSSKIIVWHFGILLALLRSIWH